ncbi:MAG: glycosyltransferase [Cyanobacteria bacterium J06598_3]
MAHIVVITSGITSALNATLALMQKLQQAGHRITYASPQNVSVSLQGLAIPFVQLPPWIVPVDRGRGSWLGKWLRCRARQRLAMADFKMKAFAQTLRELAPDLLLIDIEMHPHIMTAVVSEFRVALLCPFISIWRRPNLPPIHTAIVPGEGWRGSAWGIQWSWLRYHWGKWMAYQRDRWQRLACDYRSVVTYYARQIGYPGWFWSGFNSWLVPYPHGTLPVLCLHAQALDFPHRPPSFMHYLGPMVFDETAKLPQAIASEVASDTDPETTDSTLEIFLQNRRGEFLIYCGCSSFVPARQGFLQKVCAIAASHPHWDFVIGLGGSDCREALEGLPDNVCVLPWAPQLPLLKQADCAIINSGAHSITECIHCGVPMLLYSLGVNDQNGNAARMVHHGLGLLGAFGTASVEALSNDIQSLLTEPIYRSNLTDMQGKFQRYGEDKTAVRVISSLLSGSGIEIELVEMAGGVK